MLFSISHVAEDSKARNGILHLAHGSVSTPAFMPVGTLGTVKAIFMEDLEDLGINLILGNTYHLYLRPGLETVAEAGGLHKFIMWDKNILTDSGGFQVFSLAPFRKIEEGGVRFRSHIDGSYHSLTPEKVVEAQKILGSDILMPLDICTESGISKKKALEALVITSDWARKSRDEWLKLKENGIGELFGIVQGNFYMDLRERSIQELVELDLPGYAIGGLSVGEDFSIFREILAHSAGLLPVEKPHYLMGIGTPEYIFEAVENGMDLFDCVFPTRIARNAMAFTHSGLLSFRREKNTRDFQPIDVDCDCRMCRKYSRAYLRHLYKSKEILAPMITTYHNLYFIQNLMAKIRSAISNNSFISFKKEFFGRYQSNRKHSI
ncbi:MAG: tRNA guanosine(34) transglycosylase Tgt [Spirochaetales bacterium]|nr:tRNA guanosine(34) transglycosylase Tgt [Spirochaetales bacterium]